MPTLIYSPGIRCYIESEKHGVIDVSGDLTGGTMVRRSDGVSTFDFTLMNARRKYDGVFMPNDRIVVFMRRVAWVRTFTGLLNSVPLKTAWPREVPISASCSLKRLQYWYWDSFTAQSQTMVMTALTQARKDVDGSILNVIQTVLEKVVGWPRSKVHIGKIPQDWYEIVVKMAQQADVWTEESDRLAAEYKASLGTGATFGGVADSAGVGGSEADLANYPDVPGGFLGTLGSQTTFAGHTLDRVQRKNAELIVSTAYDLIAANKAARGYEAKVLATALAVSMVETGLRNLASDKYPESKNFPNDGSAAGDHDSVGLFQQRASWGTIAERMNPASSTKKFLHGGTAGGTPGLFDHSGWQKMSLGALAQDVQVSAYPDRYAQYEDMAYALVRKMLKTKRQEADDRGGPTGRPPRSGNSSVRTGLNALGVALSLVERYPNIRYTQQYGGTRLDILTQNPPPGLDCSSFVQRVVLDTLGHLAGTPRTSAAQAGWCRRISVSEALRTPGALLFVSRNGQPSGTYHVEMSLGDGKKTVGAHRSGVPAGVTSNSQSYWDFGGLIPALAYAGSGGGPITTGDSSSVQVGGTRHWPVEANSITTPYRAKGSWAAGYHTGIDFGFAVTGDRVEAIDNGRIVQAGSNGDYGLSVTQQVGDFQVIYGHLSQVSVSEGQKVTTGTKLGEVGDTGRSFGDHLHLEVRSAPYRYGNDVDPAKFITDGMWSSTASDGTTGGAGTTGGITDGWTDPPPASELPGYNPNDPIDALFGDAPWYPIFDATSSQSVLANALTGVRTMLNDQPLLPYIKNLFSSTMRSFCSAPNGDLIGWFPDYYGLWGTAGKLRVEPIEIQDFNVIWSDDHFVTHQFTQTGETAGLDLSNGGVYTNFVQEALLPTTTLGVANIDSPDMMAGLFGIKPKDAPGFAQWVYKRFGARPDFQMMDGLVGPKAEFFSAVYMFMRQWAYQYNSDIPMTWMPEAWPGLLLQAPAFDFQAYITTVTHSFSFGEGGRFDTMVNIAAPAYMPRGEADKNHALFGLPLASGYQPGRGAGNAPVNPVIPDLPGGPFRPGDQEVLV
jgi:murein DD-endopeptidase MepM/ murein hydrolase activator NlpD